MWDTFWDKLLLQTHQADLRKSFYLSSDFNHNSSRDSLLSKKFLFNRFTRVSLLWYSTPIRLSSLKRCWFYFQLHLRCRRQTHIFLPDVWNCMRLWTLAKIWHWLGRRVFIRLCLTWRLEGGESANLLLGRLFVYWKRVANLSAKRAIKTEA